jgi:hypothetical protein
MLHGWAAAKRFLYMFGGGMELWSNRSAEAEIFTLRMTEPRQMPKFLDASRPTMSIRS